MPLEDLSVRRNVPTLPLDANDPFRFSQLIETVKDCFQRELTTYFDYHRAEFQTLKNEIPTIEKYNLGFQPSDSAIETFTHVLLQHPDILERLPLVAITTATGSNLKLSFGGQFVAAVQPVARVKGTKTGPFALQSGDKIAFVTRPNGGQPVVSIVAFTPAMFQDLGAATIDEVLAAAAVQLLYVTAKKTLYSEPAGVLRFDAIGPMVREPHPNSIEVLGAPYSTANALSELGFVAGAKDSTATRNPANRYQLATNLTLGLDLGTESENERRELTDLLMYFFSLEMDKRDFTFYGRSVFDDDFPGEWFQIILRDQHSLSGEAEIPRQGGSGEQRDLIYINRLQVPVTIIDYVDRDLTTLPRRGDDLDARRANERELPMGDRAGLTGETSG
jgi:hypothetical protein